MTSARIVADTLVYDGWYKLRRLCVRMPCGTEVERHVEEHGDAAAVLPYDPERRMALVISLPRAPILATGEPPILEAIAGNLEGRPPEDCARIEALEEGGVRLNGLEPVGRVWTMPALSTERLHLFIGHYSTKDRIGSGGGLAAEAENIVVKEITLAALSRDLLANHYSDPKLIMLAQALLLRRPNLLS
ncbi:MULTISPECIES: ADP-ribose pyrophosphatase [Sphingobium]|uniref:ADP-ribose pyrophosphatase n=1 Tax=Sphingobium TaxID=165695 RepID=UPI001BE7902D|nr:MULTISPECIES: ADP-ribose pyrophosphatase [Sphingobium]MBT2245054.1 ADP-ribose pyrophosphatase [Sphingobium sp. BHU LFT2]WBQ19412.1 ADP-ribose pyrophosphatase [Sphingobium yanoikuyae]